MSSNQTGRLQGRVAIITGSSGGLGRAIAHRFAAEGAICFCVDKYANPRNPVNTETGKADDWNVRISDDQQQPSEQQNEDSMPTHLLLRKHFGEKNATFHAADLTDEASVEAMVKKCTQVNGRIDILVNAHGISTESTHPVPLRAHELPLHDFQLTQSINTTSFFLTCKHVLSTFLAQPAPSPTRSDGGNIKGWIVNISSIQGLVPFPNCCGYATSKGAVVLMTKQIALDYAADGIVCNSVCPGFLDTNMTRNLKGMPEYYAAVAAKQPLNTTGRQREEGGVQGGFGKVEDVARMVMVMAGDDVRWMTGQPVVVDGGYTII